MEYGLKRLVLGSKAFVPISENEYCAISEAQAGLFEAVFVEEKIDLVVENYLELETSFLDSTAPEIWCSRTKIISGRSWNDLSSIDDSLICSVPAALTSTIASTTFAPFCRKGLMLSSGSKMSSLIVAIPVSATELWRSYVVVLNIVDFLSTPASTQEVGSEMEMTRGWCSVSRYT